VADDPLKDLVEELGLSTIPVAGSAVAMEGQIVGNLDDLSEQLGKEACASLAAFDRQARDAISPAEYYFADHADRRSPVRAEPRFGPPDGTSRASFIAIWPRNRLARAIRTGCKTT
jgi:hypothetical protein